MHFYTTKEIEYLRKITPGKSNREITRMFNKKFGLDIGEKAIAATRKRYEIKTGSDGRFKKGRTPWNKGKKGVGGWEVMELTGKPVYIALEKGEIDAYTL